jgi:arylsulfatase A-like enzyme
MDQTENGKSSSNYNFRHLVEISLLVGAVGAIADVSYLSAQNSDLALDVMMSMRFMFTATLMNAIALFACLIPVYLILGLIGKITGIRKPTLLKWLYFFALLPVGLILIRSLAMSVASRNLLVPELKTYYYFLKYLIVLLPVTWGISSWLAIARTSRNIFLIWNHLTALSVASLTFFLLTPYWQAMLSSDANRPEILIATILPAIIALILFILLKAAVPVLASIGKGLPVLILWGLILFVPFIMPVITGLSYAGTRPSGNELSGKASNVILVSFDTTRYDSIGYLGNEDLKTPSIDEIASESVIFTNAITPMPVTGPSHTSMLTGLQLDTNKGHGVRSNGLPLSEDIPTLAEQLDLAGYNTAAILGGSPLSRAASGLQRGFHYYHDTFDDSIRAKIFKDYVWSLTISRILRRAFLSFKLDIFWVSKRADQVTDQAINWLNGNRSDPFFLFVHYYDAHDPYDPPYPWDALYNTPGYVPEDEYRNIDLYHGEVSFIDNEFGRLMRWCESNALMDNTLIILVADHGESFEHDYYGHVRRVYDSLVHVPIIIHDPELIENGISNERFDPLVNVSDIAYTVLDFLDVESEFDSVEMHDGVLGANPDGEFSLIRIAEELHAGEEIEPGWIFILSQSDPASADSGDGMGQFFSLRFLDAKFIYGPDAEPDLPQFQYFDLINDPGEIHNLFSSTDWTGTGYEHVPDILKSWAESQETIDLSQMDENTHEALKALGYINE